MNNSNNCGIYIFNELSDLQKISFIESSAKILNAGGVMITPTETVFGVFSCDKKKIYEIKRRPENVPFQLIGGLQKTLELIDDSSADGELALNLATKFWPGPLSIVCQTKAFGEQCLRVPNYPLLEEIFAKVEVPVFASSLNLHGQPEIRTKEQIIELFESIEYSKVALIDEISEKKASTVVKIIDGELRVLRAGDVPSEDLKLFFGS